MPSDEKVDPAVYIEFGLGSFLFLSAIALVSAFFIFTGRVGIRCDPISAPAGADYCYLSLR